MKAIGNFFKRSFEFGKKIPADSLIAIVERAETKVQVI